jgi:cholesterol transport system auxiliary component
MSTQAPIAKRRKAARLCSAALAATMLAGCGATPRETFDLSGVRLPTGSYSLPRKPQAALAVQEPNATPPAGSDRIVVRTQDRSVAFLGGAQWADRLPRLVQARLVAGLERAGVSASLPGVTVDFQLASDIRRFEIDVARGLAVIEIAARLIEDKSGRERAARVFLSEAPAPETTGALAARALEDATENAARQIAAWSRARM